MGFTDLNGNTGPGVSGYGSVPKIFTRHLADSGGIKNAIGDYSSTSKDFFLQPPTGSIYRVTRMLVLIRGPKSTFYTDSYGSVAELATGVTVRTENDSGTIINLTDDVPIHTNGNWGRFTYDADLEPPANGNSNTYLRARWSFYKSGYPLRLNGTNGERLTVHLNDDFSANGAGSSPLVEHYFIAQGYIENSEQ